ncbi:MAG TPA: SUF system NifU family Fe-S cluster assembly protein [Gemmatimonadales bacterium]|nr:SUF system NifU family Fe-S cluster assembly protein [Gemmatimonadales bacterium]
MTDLSDLYQQIIVEHNRAPRNFKKLAHPTREAEGANPLCGDQIKLEVELAGDRIADIGFQGSGCAISQASASLLTGVVQGKTTAEAQALFKAVHTMLTSPPGTTVDTSGLGKLAALAGVRQFPVRVKCASLPWHTLRAALESAAQPVSTE